MLTPLWSQESFQLGSLAARDEGGRLEGGSVRGPANAKDCSENTSCELPQLLFKAPALK